MFVPMWVPIETRMGRTAHMPRTLWKAHRTGVRERICHMCLQANPQELTRGAMCDDEAPRGESALRGNRSAEVQRVTGSGNGRTSPRCCPSEEATVSVHHQERTSGRRKWPTEVGGEEAIPRTPPQQKLPATVYAVRTHARGSSGTTERSL